MKRDSHLNDYSVEIEELRKKMIAAALDYGLDHPKVLCFSQQIDKRHNLLLKREQENECKANCR